MTTNKLIDEAVRRYNINEATLKLIPAYENLLYFFEKDEKSYVLRISKSDQQTLPDVQAEVAWKCYLSDSGIRVARPVRSPDNLFVETIDHEDGLYTACVSEKVPGAAPAESDWNESLYREWGRTMGRMHKLTKDYVPDKDAPHRRQWHEQNSLKAEQLLPPEQKEIIDRCYALMDKLHKLPVTRDSFGLVHMDFHASNFFVENVGKGTGSASPQIWLFDFEDCQYDFFMNDIATPLLYFNWHPEGLESSLIRSPDILDLVKNFFDCFMEGYSGENTIDRKWFKEIPTFLKLREALHYNIVYPDWGDNNPNPVFREFVETHQHNILNDVPYFNIDF